jgi:hypothetical protein
MLKIILLLIAVSAWGGTFIQRDTLFEVTLVNAPACSARCITVVCENETVQIYGGDAIGKVFIELFAQLDSLKKEIAKRPVITIDTTSKEKETWYIRPLNKSYTEDEYKQMVQPVDRSWE